MFLALFVIFLVFWLLGFLAFHVAGGLIHLLLVIAVIFLVVHFVRRKSQGSLPVRGSLRPRGSR